MTSQIVWKHEAYSAHTLSMDFIVKEEETSCVQQLNLWHEKSCSRCHFMDFNIIHLILQNPDTGIFLIYAFIRDG